VLRDIRRALLHLLLEDKQLAALASGDLIDELLTVAAARAGHMT
jgi:hypothetical protein